MTDIIPCKETSASPEIVVEPDHANEGKCIMHSWKEMISQCR